MNRTLGYFVNINFYPVFLILRSQSSSCRRLIFNKIRLKFCLAIASGRIWNALSCGRLSYHDEVSSLKTSSLVPWSFLSVCFYSSTGDSWELFLTVQAQQFPPKLWSLNFGSPHVFRDLAAFNLICYPAILVIASRLPRPQCSKYLAFVNVRWMLKGNVFNLTAQVSWYVY